MKNRLVIEVIETAPRQRTIKLSGCINVKTYHELAETFTCLLLEENNILKVDLANVKELSSCAYGVFMEAIATIEKSGGTIGFMHAESHASKIFKLLGVLTET